MRKILFIFLFAISYSVQAQYFDAGAGFGVSWYRGDLYHSSSEAFFKQLHGSATAFGRYNFNDLLSVRAGYTFGRITGDDKFAKDELNRQRNLSFRSNIHEVSARAEINLPGFNPYNYRKPLSPFLFVGVAWYSYNPEAYYEGEWVELQPLGTEGQGMSQFPDRERYKKSGISFPIGAGVKFALTDLITLSAEFGIRIGSNDYIDDVSTTYVPYSELLEGNGELAAALGNRTGEYLGTGPSEDDGPRGDASDNDSYGMFLITASYNFIDNGFRGSRVRTKNRRKGCRTN